MKTIEAMKHLIAAAKDEPAATPRLVNAVRSAESHVEEFIKQEPIGYFINGGDQWYEADAKYKDDVEVVPLYAERVSS